MICFPAEDSTDIEDPRSSFISSDSSTTLEPALSTSSRIVSTTATLSSSSVKPASESAKPTPQPIPTPESAKPTPESFKPIPEYTKPIPEYAMHAQEPVFQFSSSKTTSFYGASSNSSTKQEPSQALVAKAVLQSSPEFPSSPIHKFASSGNVDSLRKLIVDLDADVNLPMKDGTTPTHCAAEYGREGL